MIEVVLLDSKRLNADNINSYAQSLYSGIALTRVASSDVLPFGVATALDDGA